jgi:transposase InsO family protein
VRFGFIRDHRHEFRIRKMCQVLEVSVSGYYAWWRRPESRRSQANRALLTEIRMAHQRSRQTYGSPRMTAELKVLGHVCSENRVARLMRVSGVQAVGKRKYRVTTQSRHTYPVADNVLDRNFTVDRPNAVWLSDITYVWTSEGWLYLAAVMDLHSRMVVGWSMGPRINAELTLSALRQATRRRDVRPELVHHSDRGGQYASAEYQKLLTETQMIGSMSRKGDCWDNAPMESFFATLKTELVYRMKFKTREEAKRKIFEYIEIFYNRQRRHSSLGDQSPLDFENTVALAS